VLVIIRGMGNALKQRKTLGDSDRADVNYMGFRQVGYKEHTQRKNKARGNLSLCMYEKGQKERRNEGGGGG